MRTLGWDIALASGGPRIIETNKRWDPANGILASSRDPALAQALAGLLRTLRTFPRR
jgi:hypothetical protein